MPAQNPRAHNNPSLNGLFNATDKFKLGHFTNFVTSETRAMMAKYADPLTVNFKIIIDYDKPYGLFAPEDNIDSALAYLKRIGQDVRYEMLKTWIENFKFLVKEYDFLILGIEGLDIIQNHNPSHVFTEEDKLSITIRETADMYVQALLTNWRQIWFDDIRKVEVLPINLRRFDINVLIFSSGYYNMLFYDDDTNSGKELIETKIFPTVRKLSQEQFSEKTMEQFNHVLFSVGDCSINNDESGKPFTASVINEQNSDFIKNNLTLNFRFGYYSGLFNNISGEANFGALLALSAAQQQGTRVAEKIKTDIKDKLSQAGKDLKSSTVKTLTTKLDNMKKMVLSKNSVVGDILSKMTVDYASQMIKNTIDLGINKAYDTLVVDPMTKINNMLFMNFGNNLYELIENNKRQNVDSNVDLIINEKPITVYNKTFDAQNVVTNVEHGVKFDNLNIYSGNNL